MTLDVRWSGYPVSIQSHSSVHSVPRQGTIDGAPAYIQCHARGLPAQIGGRVRAPGRLLRLEQLRRGEQRLEPHVVLGHAFARALFPVHDDEDHLDPGASLAQGLDRV